MDYEWRSVAELSRKLHELLKMRHPEEVTDLKVAIEGDTVVLSGEVASEGCRGDAKRLALAFDGVLKVANRLEVAAFLQGASDTSDEDDFFGRQTNGGRRGGARVGTARRKVASRTYRHRYDAPVRGELSGKGRGSRIEGPGVEYASYDEEPESDAVEVNRYPTVGKTGDIAAGAKVSISVGLTVDAIDGEGPVSIGSFPADWTTIDVTVQIAGDWLKSVTTGSGRITLRRDGPSEEAVFSCMVSDEYLDGAPAEIIVYYLHGTRVCGSLRKDLSMGAGKKTSTIAEEAPSAEFPKAATRGVTIVPDATGPTLSVMIALIGADRQLWSWTAFGPDGTTVGAEMVDLEKSAKQFADSLLASCPDLPATEFRRTMRGVGEAIWRKSPQGFRDCYVGCRAKVGRGFAIQFMTEDPHVPWEMMKPDVDGGIIDHLHLEHPVARWPLKKAEPMRWNFGSGDIVSFVPSYSSRPLDSAASESEWICKSLGALKMTTTRSAFLDLLDGKHHGPVRLIHFAGHGAADTGSNDGAIELEDAPVGLMDVYQSTVTIGARDGPLVLLNACEASAGAEMLGMNTGWGAAIAARGFGGLIAPLWAVQDGMAFTMAKAALPDLVAGEATLGEAVTAARSANAEASVAALAYLAHGDVMARFARS